jgi:hypothetical protein
MAGTINFLNRVPDIAKAAGLLTQPQLADVDFVQAVFDVAHRKGVKLVPEGQKPGDVLQRYPSVAQINQLAQQHGLDKREIIDTAQMFSMGHEAQNAPYFMHTLEVLGHMPPAKKNPLLASQFSARTAETVRLLKIGRGEGGLKELLAEPMRPPRADEPSYVKASQMTHQTTQILAAAVLENPALKNDPDIERALTAIELLSAQGFKRSAEAAKVAGMSAIYDDATKQRYGQKAVADAVSNLASTSALLKKVEKGMKAAAKEVARKDPALADKLMQAFKDRKPVMQEFNVTGSLLLPEFAMRRTKMSFVEAEMQRRENGARGQGGPTV